MRTKTVAVFFLLAVLSFHMIASAEEIILENGSTLNIHTGETRQMLQNYSITVKYVHTENKQVWLSLRREGVSVKEAIIGENETLNYSRENSTIFNITLRHIYYGSEAELVTLEPVFQYVDPESPLYDNPDNGTAVIPAPGPDIGTGSDPSGVPGFGISGVLVCLAGAYLIIRIKV